MAHVMTKIEILERKKKGLGMTIKILTVKAKIAQGERKLYYFESMYKTFSEILKLHREIELEKRKVGTNDYVINRET